MLLFAERSEEKDAAVMLCRHTHTLFYIYIDL